MTGAKYTVYWQPGCTSCLRTRELLRTHAIEFESINVREHAGAMEALAALGVRSVPVVVRGRDFVLGQDIDEVASFVGVALERVRLRAGELAARLRALLDVAAQYAAQLPASSLSTALPGRTRTYRDLAYHVPMIAIAMLDAAMGGCLTFEHFKRKPPDWLRTPDDASAITRDVARSFAVWWAANDASPPVEVDTYYGRQPFDGALERTVWHIAQHVRQLEHLVRVSGVEPRPALEAALLSGLPLPENVWDEEMPLPGGPS